VTAVELRRRRPDTAEVETLARFSVPERGGPAVMEPVPPGDQAGIEAILENGVLDGLGRRVDPADGDAYLRALLETFRGSRLWAERVS
jgi:hypothetical protein